MLLRNKIPKAFKKKMKSYKNSEFEKNIILTKTERISILGENADKNILVIGCAGSYKTRGYVKSNLMQMQGSYVCNDCHDEVLKDCGKMLLDNGYKIKTLNVRKFEKSMHYNPFVYIRKKEDIYKLVDTIMLNTKGKENCFVHAEEFYYTALIGYIWYECVEEEQNFSTLLDMIEASEVREDDEEFKNPVDLMFEELEQQSPKHFAVEQYRKYKFAAGRTAKNVIISCAARLQLFYIPEIRKLTNYDELELDKVWDEKTALFVSFPDSNNEYDLIVAMMYSQILSISYDKTKNDCNEKPQEHVHFLIDDFPCIGKIPNYKILITKKRGITISMLAQSLLKISDYYKDIVLDYCDIILFYGLAHCYQDSVLIHKLFDESINKHLRETDIEKYKWKVEHAYMFFNMEKNKVVFLSKKYNVKKHKQYKFLAEYDEKNTFHIEDVLNKNKDVAFR